MPERLTLQLYSFAWWLLTPLALGRLWLKGRHQKAYRWRWQERFGHWSSYPKNCLWVHAVSVGETMAARGLIEQWQREHPDIPVLVTCMTPTGSETVHQLFGDTVHHFYLPWDRAAIQTKLVKALSPRLLIIMETELWPNLINACSKADVPILLANARMSEKSKLNYLKFASLTRPMMEKLTGVAAQHLPDADRFADVGVDQRKIQITGSVKFDISVDSVTTEHSNQLKEVIGKRPIWIAASTHPGEEEIILKAHSKLKSKLPNALLILVPRHPDRADSIGGMLYQQHLEFARRSHKQIPTQDQSVFLIDTLGEMMTFYSLADAAFIGNTLNGGGGHNPIEPAALATPVLIGPTFFNFQTIVEAMRSEQAVVIVNDDEELKNRLLGLLQSKDLRDTYGQRAYLFFQQQQGALKRLMTWIENIVDIRPEQNNPLLYRREEINEEHRSD